MRQVEKVNYRCLNVTRKRIQLTKLEKNILLMKTNNLHSHSLQSYTDMLKNM